MTGIQLRIVTLPIMVLAVFQLSGCTSDPTLPDATPGGVYSSENGGASFEQSVQIENAPGEFVSSVAMRGMYRVPEEPFTILIPAGTRGLLVSKNDGQSWQVVSPAVDNVNDVIVLSNGAWVVGGSNEKGDGFIVRSIDEGKSWSVVFTIPLPVKGSSAFKIVSNGASTGAITMTLERDPKNVERMYVGTNIGTIYTGEQTAKLWREWHTLNTTVSNLTGQAQGIRQLIPSPYTSNEVLVVTSNNKLIRISSSKESEIKVVSDAQSDTPFAIEQAQKVVTAMYVPNFPDALFVGTSNGVMVSRDIGQTWITLGVPLNTSATFSRMSLAVSPSNQNRLFVAVASTVYRSEDSGNTWSTYSLGLPNHEITDISINPANASKMLVTTQPIAS